MTSQQQGGAIGRDDAVDRVCEAVDAGRSVVVTGAAGIGKTALLRAAVGRSGKPATWGAAVDFLHLHAYLPLERALGRPLGPGDPTRVLADVVAAVGERVLVLDDLQWADTATLELLRPLADHVVLLAACRPGGASAEVADAMTPVADHVALAPLGDDAARALVRRRWSAAPATAVDRVVESAGGNPLFLRLLAAGRGAPSSADLDVVRAALDPLPAATRTALAVLSLGGALDANSPGVAEALSHGLVSTDARGAVRLQAALVGETAIASLPDEERRALHATRAAEVERPSEAAFHWLAAGDLARAHRAALDGVASATGPAARAELAVVAARTAPPATRWSCTRAAVADLLDLGRLSTIEELVDGLEGAEPPTPLDDAEREIMRARLAIAGGDVAAAEDIADGALRRLVDAPPESIHHLLVLRGGARAHRFDLVGARADADEARTLAERHGFPGVGAEVVAGGLAVLTGDRSGLGRVHDAFDQALDGAVGATTAAEAGRVLAQLEFSSGGATAGAAVCDRLLAWADERELGAVAIEARTVRALNLAFIRHGNPDVVAELRALLDDPTPTHLGPMVASVLALCRADDGALDEAWAVIERGHALAAAAPGHAAPGADGLAWASTEIAWLTGDLARCRATAETAVSAPPIAFGVPAATVVAQWAALEAGDDPGDVPGPMTIFPVQRGLLHESAGIMALAQDRPTDAVDHFETAASIHERYLVRCALRCRWAAAEALLRAGEDEAAVERLQLLAEVCRHRGEPPLLDRIEATLRRAGHPSDRDVGGTVLGLSPRQVEILELVGEGHSSAVIAIRLGLKPSTVDTHVRNAMRRLGVGSRRQAALAVLDEHAVAGRETRSQ